MFRAFRLPATRLATTSGGGVRYQQFPTKRWYTNPPGSVKQGLPKPRLLSIEELEKLHGKERLWFTNTQSLLFDHKGPGMSVPLAFAAGLVTIAGLYWVSAPPDNFFPVAKDPRKHLPLIDADIVQSLPSLPTTVGKELEALERAESFPLSEQVKAANPDDKLDMLPGEAGTAKHRQEDREASQAVADKSTLPHPILAPSDDSSQTAPPLFTPSATSNSNGSSTTAADTTASGSGADSSLLKAKYVIIGAGTAAYAAMKAIQEREKDADILMISAEQQLPYMRPPLSKELWHSSDPQVGQSLKFQDWGGTERDLFYDPETEYQIVKDNGGTLILADSRSAANQPVKARLLLDSRVKSMDVESQVLLLESGRRIKYGKCLIASGGQPKQLPALSAATADLSPTARSQFLSTFRTVEDFQRLEKMVLEGKSILIVGGGFLGSELACSIAYRSKKLAAQTTEAAAEDISKVTQVFPEDGNMALIFPRYLVDWTMEKIKQLGVQIKPQVTVLSAEIQQQSSSSGTAEPKLAVRLSDGSTILTDHVVAAIGVQPVTDFLDPSLEIDGRVNGVVVNAELEARTNVWAAGDVCSYHDIKLGRRRVEHYDHAVLSGRVAGRNMTGAHKPYKHQSFFWSDLGPEIGYEAVGILDSSLKTVGIWAKATEKDSPKQSGNTLQDKLELNGIKDSSEVTAAVNESSPNPPSFIQQAVDVSPAQDQYGKGVVFYVRDDKIVGVLLWNMFNRTSIARRVISEGRSVQEITELAKIFKIHD